jgi:hypothetical protein
VFRQRVAFVSAFAWYVVQSHELGRIIAMHCWMIVLDQFCIDACAKAPIVTITRCPRSC